MLAAERHDFVVAQIVVLHEGDGGLQRFHGFRLVSDNGLDALLFGGNILMDDSIGTEPERQAHNESNADLTYNLVLALQTVLVLAENLDIVVEEAEEAQPDGGADHQQQVDVAHAAQQQHGHKDADGDDDATHCGHTDLLFAEGIDALVAGCLGNLTTLHVLDEALAEPCRDE